MNLYEFTFIAQQNLLRQEVEEIVQELAILLKNIKINIISQKVKGFLIERESNTITTIKQELEVSIENIKESLIINSDLLESLIKILWIELEEDFSNLKEIRLKIDKELKGKLNNYILTQHLIKPSKINKQTTKSRFIYNIISAFKENVFQHLIKILPEVSKKLKTINSNQLIKTLKEFLKQIETLGLIKYEYWGLLDFAYPINKMKSGHYCMMCISSTPNVMYEFERRIKLNESIIRYLSVQVNKFFKGKSYMINNEIEEQNA